MLFIFLPPELEFRLDYQLREGKMESAYISAITSHTSYWANGDVALFILQQVFPDYSVSWHMSTAGKVGSVGSLCGQPVNGVGVGASALDDQLWWAAEHWIFVTA